MSKEKTELVAFGAYIRSLRNALNISQIKLAKKINTDFGTNLTAKDIYEYERGIRGPGTVIRAALIEVLHGNSSDADRLVIAKASCEEGERLAQQIIAKRELETMNTDGMISEEVANEAAFVLSALSRRGREEAVKEVINFGYFQLQRS